MPTWRREPDGRYYIFGSMDTTKIAADTAAHFRKVFGREPMAELYVMPATTLLTVCDTEEEARQWLR